MIYLLLGKDDFSKKEFLAELKTKESVAAADFFWDFDAKQLSNALNNSSLFEKKKIIAVYDSLGKFDFEDFLKGIKDSPNILVFIEQSLDKRKTETKKILASKNLKVLEFEIPTGAEYKKWISARVEKIGLKLSAQALQAFMEKMGISGGQYGEVLYDLWQTSSELQKLKTYAGVKEATAQDVARLVTENFDEDVFKITNAIADKNKTAAIRQLSDYMERMAGTDEKSKVINLSAILAEQFRGILIIQSLLEQKAAEAQILKLTGFSSGRLFIYKKIAKNFAVQKISDALRKLELLDQEVKTSSGPAALQFFMIVNSVMN